MVARKLSITVLFLLALAFGSLAQAATPTQCPAATSAAASSFPSMATLCSINFLAAGTCTGGDQLANLQNWDGSINTQMVTNWESQPIMITGGHIAVKHGNILYAFVGNSYTPDPLVQLAWNNQADHDLPPGTGMLLPINNSSAYLDFHVTCPSGQTFQIQVVIDYVL